MELPPTADIQYIRFVVTAHCEELRRGASLRQATWASTRGTLHRFPVQSKAVAARTTHGRSLTEQITGGIMLQCGTLQKAASRRTWSF